MIATVYMGSVDVICSVCSDCLHIFFQKKSLSTYICSPAPFCFIIKISISDNVAWDAWLLGYTMEQYMDNVALMVKGIDGTPFQIIRRFSF
jgi:hypothetical protein